MAKVGCCLLRWGAEVDWSAGVGEHFILVLIPSFPQPRSSISYYMYLYANKIYWSKL